MITYIKLGPLGDLFASSELGLNLIQGNAAEIDDTVLSGRLINFINTGFVVEITKIEYDNIKLVNNKARNIPLVSIPTTAFPILEPVESVESIPPDNPFVIGKRYLVSDNVNGPWNGNKDCITSWDGIEWQFTRPLNGMILDVWSLGISLHYTGTYPSGHWDTPLDVLNAITINPGGLTAEQYALQLVLQEAIIREAGDSFLQTQINNIISNASTITSLPASAISIVDPGNYYGGNSVEAALQEIGLNFVGVNQEIFNLSTALNALIGTINNPVPGNTIIYGIIDPDTLQGNNLDSYINTISGTFFQKLGTDWTSQFSIGALNYIDASHYGTDPISFKSYYISGSGAFEFTYSVPDAQGNLGSRVIINDTGLPQIAFSIQNPDSSWQTPFGLSIIYDTSQYILSLNRRLQVPTAISALDAVNLGQLTGFGSGLYYPLTGNPSGFLTSSSIAVLTIQSNLVGSSYNGSTGVSIGINFNSSNVWNSTQTFATGPVSTSLFANILIPSAQGISLLTTTQHLFFGAANVNMRVAMGGTSTNFGGSGASTINVANTIIAAAPMDSYTSGTHPMFANLVVNTPVITKHGASIAIATNFYVAPPSTQGNANYSAYFDGPINIQSLTASSMLFTDANKKIISSGPGTTLQFWDGTGALQTIGSSMGGLLATNFITGGTFTGTINGTNTDFVIPTTGTLSNIEVFVNGSRQLLGTDYTYNAGTKTVTFTTAPDAGPPSDQLTYNCITQ